MSIASELSALNGYILGAYDEINDKGGTVPANKNMANLATAIGSISAGSSTTIEALNVTTNGTYTAPTGTAYSPVTVNVSGGGADNNWASIINGTSTDLFDNDIEVVPDYAFMIGKSGDSTVTQGSMNQVVYYRVSSVDFPNATSVGNYAFQMWNARTYNLPKCHLLGGNMFRYNLALTEMKLPSIDSVASSSATRSGYFYHCSSLKKVDIGSSDKPLVTSSHVMFYQTCFYGCSALEALILRTPTLIEATLTNNFTGTGIANGTGYIYVPSSLLETYKTANRWVDYASQIRAIESYSSDGTVDGDITV